MGPAVFVAEARRRGAATAPIDRPASAREQAVADVELVALEQVAMARVPRAAVDVAREAVQAGGDRVGRRLGEDAHAAPHARVQVALGRAPMRAEEAVDAV